jgi:SRSO17 transposase
VDFCQNYSGFFKARGRNSSAHAKDYLSGLLSETLTKNIERFEERIAGSDYEAMQHFISGSGWDDRALMRQLACDADGLLGGDPNTALLIDETCFAKQGKHSVGVQRQWNGNLGKVDNCQCGVFAALACQRRACLLDFDLYLPEEWTADEERCRKAKVPVHRRAFQTKIELALGMVKRALDNGVRFSWVSADSFYGQSGPFRESLEDEGLNYVCDVKKSLRVRFEGCEQSVEQLALKEFAGQSEPVAFRPGTKGMLRCQVALLPVDLNGRKASLIISKDAGGAFKYSVTNMSGTPADHLYRQHQRYWIEDSFKRSKSNLGMAQYQVRGWVGWHHHMAMVALAHFFLLRQEMLFAEPLPLLSAGDIAALLDYFLPRRQQDFEAVCQAILKRHQKRFRDIEYRYRKENIPIPETYLPK